MNRIVRTIAFAVALTGTLGFAQQQQTPPPDASPIPAEHVHTPSPARQAAHLAKQLNLTPDQTAKVQPILADRDQKIDALRGNTSLSRKDMHRQMRSIQEDTLQQLSTVLTPEQTQQMKAMHHHHGGKDAQTQTAPAPGL